MVGKIDFSSIALIADKRNWAFDSIARHVKSAIERYYPVSVDILYTEDYINERKFLAALNLKQYDVIHFFWRGFLKNLVDHYLSTREHGEVERAFVQAAVSFSIPEGLFTGPDDVFDFSPIFHLADGYCTVSQRLFNLYCQQILLPPPHSAIYDRTDLIVELTDRPRTRTRKSGDALNVLWAGNSEWGQWLGLDDPKGVRIIAAAVEKARQAGTAIRFIGLDGAKQAVSQEDVGKAMLEADVYVCAAGDQEGTPLPVLEAMSAGCAVVTADVGAGPEIFPSVQRELIVARNAAAFADALQRCARDLTWTADVGSANRETMRQWCRKPLHEDWMHFFADTHTRSRLTERRIEKRNIISNLGSSSIAVALGNLRSIVRRSPLTVALAKRAYPYALPVLRKLRRSNRLGRLAAFRKALLARADVTPIPTLAIYTPMWAGVAASTRALFERTLPLPFFVDQYPEEVTPSELAEYVEIVRALSPRRLVLSGAEQLHWNFLQIYRAACPQTHVEIVSHSGQLQWTENHHRREFMMWLPECHAGRIDKIWVVKRGLDVVLRSQGIESELIENFLPQRTRIARRLREDGPVRIGIWSIDSGWRKNLISQFLAFAGNRKVEIYHTSTDPVLTSLLSTFGVPNVRVNEGPLPHTQMLSWLAKMDINLYVTLSECSAMLPLESISLGVPVVVGPTTTFFDDDPFLRQRLVATSPEDMGCIRSTVDGLLADYNSVAEAIIQLGHKRELLFAETRRRLNRSHDSRQVVRAA